MHLFKFSKVSILKHQLYQLLLGILLLQLPFSLKAQTREVSVPFDDGFIGLIGSNSQQATNIQRFATLTIARAYFVQQTASGRFENQGNDIPGTLRLQLRNGSKIDMPGALVWRINSGNTNELLGFVANSSVLLNLNSYGGPNYSIQGGTANGKSNFGFKLNNSTYTLQATGGSESGNAANNLLDLLNSYLDALPRVLAPSPRSFDLSTPNQDPGDFSLTGFPNQTLLCSVGLVNPPAGTTFSLSVTNGLTRSTGYNSWTGLTRISFTGTQAAINTALASMSVSTGSNAGNINISVSATVNPTGYFYFPPNGHFYKPMSWPAGASYTGASATPYNNLKALCAQETYRGQPGYLMTITSAEEDNFVNNNVPGSNIIFALTDKDLEGTFKIDDGPEAGTIVRVGPTNQPGVYNNWDTGEPNNWGSGEDYVVTKWSGGTKWNDFGPEATAFPGSISGYVIEFGTWTNPDDQAFTDFYSASTTYTANCAAQQTPAAPTVATQGSRAGSGTVQLSVTVPAGTTADWYLSETGGTVLAGGTGVTTFTTPVIATTTNFYVQTRNTSSGCLSTTRTLVTATVEPNTPPTITSMVNQTTSGTTPTTAQNFTVGDAETAAASLTVTASSSNTTLIPTNNIVFSGSGANRSVVVTAASGQTGTATITLTVNDGTGATATSTFTVTVNDPNCSTFSPLDFQLNGNATVSNNIITLTTATGNQRGGAWNKNKIFLDKDFDISSRINLGTNDANGADGIAFVLQNQSINAGSSGGGLGYQGITPSFAVEFDTWDNGTFEPDQDHMAIIANGAAAGAHNIYATPFEVQMEDGQWHNVRFVWTANTKNFQAWYDGVKRFDITVDLKATIFNNADYVFWGLTAATGGSVNLQQVEITNYCYTKQASITPKAGTNNASARLNLCTGSDVVLEASNADTYQWFKDNVAIAGATGQTLTVADAGSYKVETVSNGITTVSEATTVTVSALPSITYPSATYSFIRDNTITSMAPVVASGSATPSSYSVSPALPTGLTLNTTTGVISGRPTALAATANYTVTANTAAGCSTTFSLSIEVKNDVAPSNLVYNPNSQTVRQGTAITNMLPTVSGGAVITYTIAPSLPSGITINATTGIVSGTLSSAQTGSQVYTVTATNTGGTATATITLIYNSAPTDITSSASSIAENNAANATVGTLSSTDPDAGDTHTYTLVSGTGSTDNAAFNISGNSLRVNAALDFETKSSYSIRIRTTDAGGLSFEKAFTISVTNANEAPTDISSSASSIAENNTANATVGTLSSTDPDAGDTYTYTLVSGAGSTDNAAFNISGNSLRATNALDFETKSSYSIRIRTTDAGGLSFDKVFTVTVTNVNEAPTNISSTQLAIYENNTANATVGTLSSTDPDAGDTHTYTLVSGAGSTDNSSFSIVNNQLKAAVVFKFKDKESYNIRIRTTDAGGLTFEKTFTIGIIESPVASGTGNLPGTNQITAASNDVTISKGYSSQLNVAGPGLVTYNWSPSIGLSATNVANPIASPLQTTIYTVTVTNALGLSTVLYVTVNVVEDYNVTPSNIITPNGDGINDYWVIDNLDSYPDNEVQIFDKAGRVLYQVKDYQNNWDGTINSNLLAEGTYYYVINFGSGKKIKKGYITIIRD